MTERTEQVDLLDVLAGMRPDPVAEELGWPLVEREQLRQEILAGAALAPRSRVTGPRRRWIGALAAAAAIVVTAWLVVPAFHGTGMPAEPAGPATSPTASTPVPGTAGPGTASPSTTPTPSAGPITARCRPASRSVLVSANDVGNVGGYARFVSGQMVKADHGWWMVAVKAEVTNPEYRNVNGINDEGLMAFATDEPSGDSHWIPLSDQAEWDGETPTGEVLPRWSEYRAAALDCVRGR